MNEARPVLTTIKPISHPKKRVKQSVRQTANQGSTVAMLRTWTQPKVSPSGVLTHQGRLTWNPHFSMTPIHIPANPIIEPIERSNSPAMMSSPAPIAMMPSCAISRVLLRIPSALKPSPAKGFQESTPAGIEKKPSASISRINTPKGPISGLWTRFFRRPRFLSRSDSVRPTGA